jgi:Yip1-like protein
MNADTTQVEAAPAAGPAQDAPSKSAIGTLIGIFVEPRRTFAALAAKPRILAPILLLVVFQLVFAAVLTESGIIRSDTVAKLEAKNTPQDQIDNVEKVMSGPVRYVFVLTGPVVMVFWLLVIAGILYFTANLMLGARLRFAHYLCIVAYGSVVATVDQLVRLGLMLGRGTLHVAMGVGAFLGEDLGFGLRFLDAATDPLVLWAVVIQALGVAVMARKGFGFGLLAVLPGTLILFCISALQR